MCVCVRARVCYAYPIQVSAFVLGRRTIAATSLTQKLSGSVCSLLRGFIAKRRLGEFLISHTHTHTHIDTKGITQYIETSLNRT